MILCAEPGVTQEVPPDYAQYLMNWMLLLKKLRRGDLYRAALAAAERHVMSRLEPVKPA